MELIVSLKPAGMVRNLGLPTELDLNDYLRMRGDWFLPLVSSEIEDMNLDLRQLRLNLTTANIERSIQLADYLNVSTIVTGPAHDAETMIDMMDVASSYGVRLVWELRGSMSNVDVVEGLIQYSMPHKLRVAMHVARGSSLRNFIKDMIQLGDHVTVLYFNNKKPGYRGLPIFDGSIDYLKVTKILRMLRYDEAIVLRYRPEYYGNYTSDFEVLSSFINSLGGSQPDKALERSLERLINEVMSEAANR